jgi:hypothetical protein
MPIMEIRCVRRWKLRIMAKSRALTTEKNIAKKIKLGLGSGEGKDYQPWIRIHDFASRGTVSRVHGLKTGRLHQFLSELEKSYFYLLEWSDAVVDIREQFPILDRDKTISIAERKCIRYPADPKTNYFVNVGHDHVPLVELIIICFSIHSNRFPFRR